MPPPHHLTRGFHLPHIHFIQCQMFHNCSQCEDQEMTPQTKEELIQLFSWLISPVKHSFVCGSGSFTTRVGWSNHQHDHDTELIHRQQDFGATLLYPHPSSPILFFFSGPHPRHIEVPRLGGQSELQLLVYTTFTATWDPSHICDLPHSSRQPRILNPLREARD